MNANTASEHPRSEDESLKACEKSIPTYDATSISAEDWPDKNVQHGVQAAEAVTAIWDRKSLVAAYAMYVPLSEMPILIADFDIGYG